MRTRNLALSLVVGALSVTGCGDDNKSSTDAAARDTTPTSPVATSPAATSTTAGSATVSETSAGVASPLGQILFQDPFDDDRNGWGVIDDSEFGSAAYDGGDYVWVFSGRVSHWLPGVLGDQYDRGELEMRNVVVKAEATVEAGGGVIGVFCRETPDTDAEWQWYEFVARDGFAAIRRADLEANLDVLAETNDVSLPIGEPIAFEATCVDDPDGHAQLSLSLNGAPVLDATDENPLGNGVSGLQAWTFPAHEQMDIRWHDFSIEQPES
jgi:hypothetical protein